ncbi:hypothetical protein OS493_029798 [Desmophyllum pertusum]|uniref:Uncharacterized protein n=1 Tax=Desmophyllum pertusum TaxID=174260 RepID=A0A9W9YZB4_9CNID|nr:hypothetical protein OS493_029798 [Desmophyllum pertusum]
MREMQDTVESAATKVSRQSVKIKVKGHQIHPGNRVRTVAAVAGITASIGDTVYSRAAHLVQFINETDFPMKIASGRVGMMKCNLEFVHDIEPRSSCWKNVRLAFSFSTGGYLIIYLNGILSSDAEPPAGNARVIEFAMSSRLRRINMQDKTCHEFTRGQDTYDMMMKCKAGEAKSQYWFDRGMHFMARGEIAQGGAMVGGRQLIWRFVVQEFDPLAEQELTQ